MFPNSHHSRRTNPTRTPTADVFTSISHNNNHPTNNHPSNHPSNHNTSSSSKMARKYQSRPHNANTTTTTTTTTRHGLFRRKVHHQKRKTTLSDKIAGGLKKLKGTITRNPAVKAAGTRRMHGTDGRGSHRY